MTNTKRRNATLLLTVLVVLIAALTPQGALAAPKDGTIKIDGVSLAPGGGNEPHDGCQFVIEFAGYETDDGSPLNATWTFEAVPPTANPAQTLVSGSFSVDGDSPGGGDPDGQTGVIDLSAALAAFGAGHAQQGYHVHVEVTVGSFQAKQKTFFVRRCPATLVVDKQTSPMGDTTQFDFTVTEDPDTNLPAPTTFPHVMNDLTGPGGTQQVTVYTGQTYTVTEESLTGALSDWTLSSASCNDGASTRNGQAVQDIVPLPNATITCTFTNSKATGTIRIDKDVTGVGASQSESFAFSDTIPSGNVNSLTHASTPVDFTVPVGSGYSVTEDLTALQQAAGWSLTSATCTNGTAANIIVTANTVTTCTFLNTYTAPAQTGTIEIDKNVTGPGASANEMFAFTDTIPTGDVASMNHNAAVQSFTVAANQSYSVSENITNAQQAAGWALTSATCSDGSPIGSIAVGDNETVRCTFLNTYTPPPPDCDNDGIPDASDTDDNNDCQGNPPPQPDCDNDGIPDASDTDDNNDCQGNPQPQPDCDNDGIPDASDTDDNNDCTPTPTPTPTPTEPEPRPTPSVLPTVITNPSGPKEPLKDEVLPKALRRAVLPFTGLPLRVLFIFGSAITLMGAVMAFAIQDHRPRRRVHEESATR